MKEGQQLQENGQTSQRSLMLVKLPAFHSTLKPNQNESHPFETTYFLIENLLGFTLPQEDMLSAF